VAPDDVDALARAVAAVADPTPSARRRIRAHALRRFSLERQLDDIEAIHRSARRVAAAGATSAVAPVAETAVPA
jgi:hypothetical protein